MIPFTVVALFLTTGILLGLAAVGLQYRGKQGAELFSILQAVSAAWAAITAFGLTMPQGAARIRVWGLTTGLSLLVIVLWLSFILSYTGREHWFTAGRLGVVSLPLVLGAGLYFVVPAWQPLVGQLGETTIVAGTSVVSSIGPVGGVLGAYVYLVFLVGLGFVVKTVLEGSRLFVGQAVAFVVGSAVTIVASFLTILGVPVDGYPLTQVALSGQALFWGYAIFGQQLLQFVPAVAAIGEQAVFEELTDGLLVVDTDGTVVRANPRVRSYLDAPEPTGEPVAPLLASMDAAAVEDLPTRFKRGGQTFRTDVSPIRNWQGNVVGHALVVRDVTPLATREQRLTVLNRILRHNVRNDMNLVMGIGSRLERRGDEELAALGETLRRTGRNLSGISDKAIEIDRLSAASTARKPVSLPTAIEEVVSPLTTEHPDATVTWSVDAGTVRTDPQLLSRIVEEVVVNALEHAGEAPTVHVEVTPEEPGVGIAVTDDGPGIPEAELTPIVGGDETDLQHASSFGLWFVSWGVRLLGGTVDVETSASGTTVTLTVPRDGADDDGTRVESPAGPLLSD